MDSPRHSNSNTRGDETEERAVSRIFYKTLACKGAYVSTLGLSTVLVLESSWLSEEDTQPDRISFVTTGVSDTYDDAQIPQTDCVTVTLRP